MFVAACRTTFKVLKIPLRGKKSVLLLFPEIQGFPGGSHGKESACNAGYLDSIPGLGRSPGEGNGNPLQYSAWEIPWTEEPSGLFVLGCKELDMTGRLTLSLHFTELILLHIITIMQKKKIGTAEKAGRNTKDMVILIM